MCEICSDIFHSLEVLSYLEPIEICPGRVVLKCHPADSYVYYMTGYISGDRWVCYVSTEEVNPGDENGRVEVVVGPWTRSPEGDTHTVLSDIIDDLVDEALNYWIVVVTEEARSMRRGVDLRLEKVSTRRSSR